MGKSLVSFFDSQCIYQILHGHYDTELDATFVLLTTLKLEVTPRN